MQSLRATRGENFEKAVKRDPAPSRVSYRIHRLWLTPFFRMLVRKGIPLVGLLAAAVWYFGDMDRIERIQLSVTELRTSIEQRPEFMVKLMRIENASVEVSEDIREVMVVDFPVSSFDLDLDEMRMQIEQLDAVAKANLIIRTGGMLDIEVVERIPAIVWRGRQGLELLDHLGHRVSTLADRTNRADLPLIVGEGAEKRVPEALALMATAEPLAERVRGLVLIGERRWDIVMDRDQRIMLPQDGAAEALERVIALNAMKNLLARDLTILDMRDGRRPVARLTKHAIDRLHGIEEETPDGENAI